MTYLPGNLTPLDSKKSPSPLEVKKIATWDIEAEKWTDVALIGVYYPRTDDYWEFKSMAEFADHIFTRKRRSYHFWAHNAGKYDDLLLWRDLMSQVNYEFDILDTQGSIVRLKVTDAETGYQWFFHDSIHLVNQSLEDLTDAYDVIRKGDFDYKKIKADLSKMSKKDREDLTKYLRRDCEALWEVLEQFREQVEEFGGRLGLTRASTAMKTWRNNYWPSGVDSIENYKTFEPDVKKAYHGGRCEVFRKAGENINVYDINSLYPDRMREPMPVGRPEQLVPSRTDLDTLNGVISCKVETPDMDVPILPVEAKVSGTKKLIFPVGVLEGVWDSEELKFALNHGYELKKINWAIDFPESKPIFREYVRRLYGKKTELKRNGKNGAKYQTIKVLLNSLYGKTAMSRHQDSVVHHPTAETIRDKIKNGESIIPYDEKIGLYKFLGQTKATYIVPAVATRITALARLKLWKALYEYKDNLYYCDTDSVFIDAELDPELVDPFRLGAWDLEAHLEEAYFLGAKLYAGRKPDGEIKKGHKGLHSSAELDFLQFKKAHNQKDGSFLSVSWTNPSGWKSSLKKSGKPISVEKRTRVPSIDNRKREWHGDSSLALEVVGNQVVDETDQEKENEYQRDLGDRIYDFYRKEGYALNPGSNSPYMEEFSVVPTWVKAQTGGKRGDSLDEGAERFGISVSEFINALANTTPLKDREPEKSDPEEKDKFLHEQAKELMDKMEGKLKLTPGNFYWDYFQRGIDRPTRERLLSENGSKTLSQWSDTLKLDRREIIETLSYYSDPVESSGKFEHDIFNF